jgi:hypothetical protein
MNLRLPAFVSIALLFLCPEMAAAERTVVLVTNDECPISELSNLEIRKAYVGIAVIADGYPIRPMRLIADRELNRIFFQAIVAMSEKSYERRALSLAIRFGTPRPEEFTALDKAFDALDQSTCGVLFLWGSDAPTAAGNGTIKVLWRGD